MQAPHTPGVAPLPLLPLPLLPTPLVPPELLVLDLTPAPDDPPLLPELTPPPWKPPLPLPAPPSPKPVKVGTAPLQAASRLKPPMKLPSKAPVRNMFMLTFGTSGASCADPPVEGEAEPHPFAARWRRAASRRSPGEAITTVHLAARMAGAPFFRHIRSSELDSRLI